METTALCKVTLESMQANTLVLPAPMAGGYRYDPPALPRCVASHAPARWLPVIAARCQCWKPVIAIRLKGSKREPG